MRIWKFPLEATDMQEITVPDGADLLSVANQNGTICLWVMVDPSAEPRRRYIEIIGTGNSFSIDMGVDRVFIGTVIVNPFVWHVFERR